MGHATSCIAIAVSVIGRRNILLLLRAMTHSIFIAVKGVLIYAIFNAVLLKFRSVSALSCSNSLTRLTHNAVFIVVLH